MKLYLFAVYDSGVEAYSPPFTARARGEAVRLFSDLCNDANTSIGKHPTDYLLSFLGEFDDKSGSFDAVDIPVRVISGIECINNALADEAEHKVPASVVKLAGM